MDETRKPPNYPLYFPEGLREALQAEADRQHRSLHNLIIHILSEHVAAKERR